MPTYTELMRGFEIGAWTVKPDRGLISRGDTERKLEPLVMDVFVVLASHAGDVVTKDQLIDAVWDGRPQTDDVITRCIASLRRGLDDSARSPAYIETIQRRGYRVMAPVVMPDVGLPSAPATASSNEPRWMWIGAGIAAVVAIVFYAMSGTETNDVGDAGVSSVSVFPFDCMLDTEETSEHLCFGFAEEAISSLNKIEDLKVVRNRQQYSGDLPIAENGLVTGSVQIIGDQVKISAQLEDTRSGAVIWTDTFDADRGSIFELQREVAFGLRGAIDAEFEEPVTDTGIPKSYAAAEAYSRGRFLFERRNRQSTETAVAQFEQAIQLDPAFGPAWLGLAYTYCIWPDYDLTVDRETSYKKALEIVDQGIAADPSIRAAAGTVYGFVNYKRSQWIAAAEAFEPALQADDVEPIAHHWYSRVMASVGRLDLALEHSRLSIESDPNHPDKAIMYSSLAIGYFWVNDMENARRYFDIANSMDLQSSIHSLAYALFLIRSGDIEGAKTYAKVGLDQNNIDSVWVNSLLEGLEAGGDRERSIGILMELSAADALPENVEMTLWMLLGEVERAMTVARGLGEQGGWFEIELIFIDEFAAFRQHPDFPKFLADIGLTEYWASAGCAWANDQLTCT